MLPRQITDAKAVSRSDYLAWAKARELAGASGIEVVSRGSAAGDGITHYAYVVTSGSSPFLRHSVDIWRVVIAGKSRTLASCDCGERGACIHAALGLEEAHIWRRTFCGDTAA